MFFFNVLLTVKRDEDIPAVKNGLARMCPLVNGEAGCRRWEAYQSQENPHLFILIEHWETREDWERHADGFAIQEIYRKQVIPLVTREPHPSDLIQKN